MTDPQENPQGSPPAYKEGRWWPAWAILITPFLIAFYFLQRAARSAVNWKAAWAVVAAFEAVVFPAEWYSLRRGHWVYNEARILGPKLLGVPIEEPFLYYLFSPLIVITLMCAIRMKLAEREKP